MGIASSLQSVFVAVERPVNLPYEEDGEIYAEIAIDDKVHPIKSWPAPPISVVVESQGSLLRVPPKQLRCSFWAVDGAAPCRPEQGSPCMEVLVPQSIIEEFQQPAFQLWLGLLNRSEMPEEAYPTEEQAKSLFDIALREAKSPSRPKVCLTFAITTTEPAFSAPAPAPLPHPHPSFRNCCGEIGADSCLGGICVPTNRCEIFPLDLDERQDPFEGALHGPVMKLLQHHGDIIKEVCTNFRITERDLKYTRREFTAKEKIYHGQLATLLGHKRDLKLALLRSRDVICGRWLLADDLLVEQLSFHAWFKATFCGTPGVLHQLLAPCGPQARPQRSSDACPPAPCGPWPECRCIENLGRALKPGPFLR